MTATNTLFFGALLIFGLLAQVWHLPPGVWLVGEVPFSFEENSLLVIAVVIFFSNLIFSAFVLVTLTGVVFFPSSVVVLLMRAAWWGFLLIQLPTPQFLFALPTLVLEGEGYVLASIAGITLGLSWLKPDFAYRGEKLSRLGAFKKAMKECARLYILVAMLLLVAAVVETITLVLLAS